VPLIAYKLILISLDLQRLREIANHLEENGEAEHADFLRKLTTLAEEI
jgi:hypothetical protein